MRHICSSCIILKSELEGNLEVECGADRQLHESTERERPLEMFELRKVIKQIGIVL